MTSDHEDDAANDNGGEEHDHTHERLDELPAGRGQRRPMVLALTITSVFLIVEVIGAYVSNSLALLADAAHMLTDVAAIALALFAMSLARRPATPERTFGFMRAEILAALVNAVALIVMAMYIFWEAWHRLQDPPEVQSTSMLVVAIAGLGANIAAAWVLSRGGGHKHNLNTRGAFLHVLGDLLGSVAAIIAAVIIAFTGWFAADPILSAVIGGLVVFSAWSLLRESVEVLLESAPRGIAIPDLRQAIESAPGVEGVHDLHVWTVTSGFAALSAHIETRNLADWPRTMTNLADMLRDRFDIVHVTLQPESPRPQRDAGNHCSFEAPAGQAACLTARSATPRAAHAGHRH
jgi:cobalt-zinc-cadmium efflux system protein